MSLFAGLLPQQARATAQCYTQTHQCIDSVFLERWQRSGGVAVFGMPITATIWEDGYQVQYFERNRFEFHPEHAPDNRVELGQLGAEQLRMQGRDWRALQRGQPSDDCLWFEATGHSVCAPFRSFWERSGGVAIFGYPLSEPQLERSPSDGQARLVQYFERNRFELHADQPPTKQIQLGLLGAQRVNAWFAEAAARPASPVRASVHGPAQTVAPFANVALTVNIGGYTGAALLRLIDSAGVLEAEMPLDVRDGIAAVTIIAGGALGGHTAVVLIDGQIAGVSSNVYTLDAQTSISTGVERYDNLLPRLHTLLQNDTAMLQIDGQQVYGYRSPDSPLLWLRDHVYQQIGFRYFEPNMTSLLDYFRRTQHSNGAFDDYVGNDLRGRMDVEADLEFLYVLGTYQAWQATGDDTWLRENYAAMARGIAYATSDPLRWDATTGLIKRPFTIDTWDFEVGPPTISPDGKPALRHWFDQQTRFGIMHGDNTGMAQAMALMGQIAEHLGRVDEAAEWRSRSAALIERLNQVSWNGSFFTHTIHLTPGINLGVDEQRQLSLSNALALNRGVLRPEQATAILNEYQQRRAKKRAFAEWFSIDPAFPQHNFGDAKGVAPGEYVNGGIMPFVGGELARGAFRWGQERYGFDILSRYNTLLNAYHGGSYLWYYPNGVAGASNNTTLASDGWGAAAMLAALTEGAAGVTDHAALLHDVELAPRWSADEQVQQATVVLRYGASLGYVAYHWERLPNRIRMQATGASTGQVRVLLPPKVSGDLWVTVAGSRVPFTRELLGASTYVVLPLPASLAPIEIGWQG